MKRVLFICTGNSCRSQMAEGFGNIYLRDYNISSAGINPEEINPYAIQVMQEIKIDISNQKSSKINNDDLINIDLVITLCGDAKDKCPILKISKHLHWDISDPAKFKGNKKNTLLEFSKARDIIYDNIILLRKNIKL